MVRFLWALESYRRMGKLVLRDHALLEKLGMLPVVCEQGYYHCERKDDRLPGAPQKPYDEESAVKFQRRLEVEELNALYVTFIKNLKERDPQLFRRGLFIMDSNHFTLKGSHEQYKWCALKLWTPSGMITVAVEFSATNGEGTGETSIGRRVLERALKAYGEGFIKELLVDSGYLDGSMLRWLKEEHHIDWVTDAKEGMIVSRALEEQSRERPQRPWVVVDPPKLELRKNETPPTRRVMWLGEQRSLPTYGLPVNVCLVWDHYPKSQEHPEARDLYWCIMTSHLEWKAPKIHREFRRRWEIENTYGAMSVFWGLGAWQIERYDVYRMTIYFMALTYALVVVHAYEQKLKTTLRGLADLLLLQSRGRLLVLCGGAAAVVTIAEFNAWMENGLIRLRAP